MTRLTTALVPLVLICAAAAEGQDVPTNSCVGRWSPPFPVQGADGRPVYIERGVVTVFDDRALVLGSPTFFWLRKHHMAPPEVPADTAALRWAFTRPGALIDSNGTASGVPVVDTLRPRTKPRLVGSRRRLATVAWAAFDSDSSGPGADPDRVDLASFDGRQWSAPRIVIRAPGLRLSHGSAIRAGVEFDPAVVVVAARDATGPFVRVARLSGERWSTVDWRGPAFIIHRAIAPATTDRSVSILMTAAMKDGATGVFSLRGEWAQDSLAWTQPKLIDSLPGAFDLSSARLGTDSVIVAWYSRPKGGAPGALVTALSIDAGSTWTLTTPLAVRSGMDGARLVVDSAGGLHIVYRGAPEDEVDVLNAPGTIMHSYWLSGAWTPPTAVSLGSSVTAPAAGPAPRGRLMAIWADAVVVPEGAMPKSLASLWTPGCTRP